MKQIANDIFFQQVEQELRQGNTVMIPLKGHSMYPFIRDGKDKVLLAEVSDRNQLKKLDIVLFRYNGKHILHRIVAIDGFNCTIQGDGIYASKEYCKKTDIVALAVEIHRLRTDGSYNTIQVSSSGWRFLSALWLLLSPLRRYLLYILRCPFLNYYKKDKVK